MSAEARLRYARANAETDLRRAFDKLDSKHDKKIDAEELLEFFRAMGEHVKKSEADDMVWEVDEDLDGALTWKEFQQMFQRCDEDITDFEPRQLFNVIQFVMMDKDGRGIMSLEDAMKILYLRNGRQHLDEQLKELFGTCDLNSGKVLTLREFLAALSAHQVRQLVASTAAIKNYKAPLPGSLHGKEPKD